MKALSVVAPSGMMIAVGRKTLEVRRWRPGLAPVEDLLIVENDRFVREPGEEDPNGRAVAIVRVSKVRPFLPVDMEAAYASYYEEGWLAWELTDVRRVRSRQPVVAARGIYEVDLALEREDCDDFASYGTVTEGG